MILTEEQAKTKACHLSFRQELTEIRDGYSSYSPAGFQANCVGSQCMAWRDAPQIQGGPVHEIIERKGYCGLAW
jgi:hypothetical protein